MSAFLDSLEPAERAELEALFETVTYDAGERLFAQGDIAEGAFLIDAGEIVLELVLPGGGREAIATVGPGDFLGEPAWLDRARRTLDARALTPVRARHMYAQDFRSLIQGFRPSGFHLTQQIARLAAERIRATEDVIGSIASGRDPQALPSETEPLASAFDPRPYLEGFEFFQDFTPREIDAFLDMGEMLYAPRGTRLASGDGCHFVMRGAIGMHLLSTGDRIALLGPGRLYGVASKLLDAAPHTDLRVREDADLFHLGDAATSLLLTPVSRLSYRFMLASCLEILRRLDQTNRTLSRTRRQAGF